MFITLKFLENFKNYESDYEYHVSNCFDCQRPDSVTNLEPLCLDTGVDTDSTASQLGACVILFKHTLRSREIKIKDVDGKLHSKNSDDGNFAYFNSVSKEKRWYCRGLIHRGFNKPAIVRKDGSNAYYLNGFQYEEKIKYNPKNINLREFDSNPRINDAGIINLEPFTNVNKEDIFVFPSNELPDSNTKCWWFHREEIEAWWKGKPENTHPLTRSKLSTTMRERIIAFTHKTFF
jgi:hypothetical protein